MHLNTAAQALRISNGAQFATARTLAEIAALREDWQRLERASPDPCFFQSYTWCHHIAKSWQNGPANTQFTPCVAVRRIAGKVTAIWPLSLQKSGMRTSLRSLDDPFGQFAGIIAETQDEADALVRDCVAHFRTSKGADGARINNVPTSGRLFRALQTANFKARDKTQAPYIALSGFADFTELKRSRNKKSMKNLRNASNSIARNGEVLSEVYTDPQDVRGLIARTTANRLRWLADTGNTAPAFRVPGNAEIMADCASELPRKCIGFELYLNGQSIAQQWGFVHCSRYYAYMSGVSPDAWAHSPGKIHLSKVIEAAMDQLDDGEPLRFIEFLTPASPYKMVWTDETHELITMAADFTQTGRISRVLWDDTLRPAIKKAFYALPTGLRGKLSHRMPSDLDGHS